MPTLRAALAALCLLALTGLAAPAALAAPTDSTEALADDPLAWARAVVNARRAVTAAETEPDPDRQVVLATDALRAVRELETEDAASVRELRLRAQAVYEAVLGPVAPPPLAPGEWADLRGDALASLGPTFEPDLVDPAVVAAQRAEAQRLAGPAWLFYPTDGVPAVDRQRGAARGLARTVRRHRTLMRQIERTLRRRGLPTDLKYVAVIESALDPQAESWAGAQGLWQFMPETGAQYGLDSLTVFETGPATEAAARYLSWLGRRFDGDWHLALAAYNCGIGRVQTIVRDARAELGREPTFWDIRDALPRETQHYVPRFIAVAEALGARDG